MPRARRGQHEGSVYQRSRDGRWCAEVSLGVDASGRRRRKIVTGATKTEALERLRQVRLASTPGEVAATRHTVETLAAEWLADVRARRRANTVRVYERALRLRVLPRIGHVQVKVVKPAALVRLLEQIEREGLGGRAREQVHHALRRLFRFAIERDYLQTSPMARVPPPRYEPEERQVWTAEQARAFLAATRDSPRFVAFALVLTAGLRSGELRGLRWGDVDFERGVLHVQRQQALVLADGQYRVEAAPPKSAASRRRVALGEIALAALRAHREKAPPELRGPDAWILATRTGRPVTAANLHAEWRRARERVGLPPVTFHDLRHTAATLMLDQGVNAKVLSDILGHSHVSTTLATYAHVLPEARVRAARLLDSALGVDSQLTATGPTSSAPAGRRRAAREPKAQ